MAVLTAGATTIAGTDAPNASRLLFVDNIRWSMIILVLSMHACDTYSPFGNWYYVDRQQTGFGTTLFFGLYQSFLQAFFMAALFFIAGYFAAAAYDRKGFARFVRDRVFRLGLPTLFYMLVIGPFTQYFLSRTWGTGGFAHQWVVHLEDGEWLSETGPMWFCAVLLLFSIAYGLIRRTGWTESRLTADGQRKFGVAVAGFVAIMAISTFLVRVVVSEGTAVLNVHPGDVPQYVLMFGAGGFGYRGQWMSKLPEPVAMRWASFGLAVAIPLFALLIVLGGALQGETVQYGGGFNPVSAGKCLWEALICVAMGLLMLAVYRRHFDRQGAGARGLSENAFGVYLIHPPVLITSAMLLHAVALPAFLKAMLLTTIAAVGSFAASAVLRASPLRAIL